MNFSKLSSADKITANLVKNYISVKLKFSKYPSKHRRSLAVTVGCLVGLICPGRNSRHALAYLPLLAPHSYFKFSLAEENSAKSYCFRGFKCLNSASHKMGGKCEMVAGPVVVVQLGSSLGLKSRGGHCPPVESAGLLSRVCFFRILSAFPHPNPILLRFSQQNYVLNSEN